MYIGREGDTFFSRVLKCTTFMVAVACVPRLGGQVGGGAGDWRRYGDAYVLLVLRMSCIMVITTFRCCSLVRCTRRTGAGDLFGSPILKKTISLLWTISRLGYLCAPSDRRWTIAYFLRASDWMTVDRTLDLPLVSPPATLATSYRAVSSGCYDASDVSSDVITCDELTEYWWSGVVHAGGVAVIS